MNRSFRNLALLFVAMVAVSAIAASAAGATVGKFSWSEGTTQLSFAGDGEQVLGLSVGSIKCNSASGSAAVTGTEALSVGAKLTFTDAGEEDKCRGPLGTMTGMKVISCTYRFNAGTTVGELGKGETEGTLDLVECSSGPTSFGGPGCTIRVPEQSNLGPVFYRTVKEAGQKERFTIEGNITNLHYETEGLCGTGTGTNGTYALRLSVKGFTSKGVQTDATVT